MPFYSNPSFPSILKGNIFFFRNGKEKINFNRPFPPLRPRMEEYLHKQKAEVTQQTLLEIFLNSLHFARLLPSSGLLLLLSSNSSLHTLAEFHLLSLCPQLHQQVSSFIATIVCDTSVNKIKFPQTKICLCQCKCIYTNFCQARSISNNEAI